MKISLFLLLFISVLRSDAQTLKPGFDADEYIDVLLRCAGNLKIPDNKLPKELEFKPVYSSPEMGLHNKYEVWINSKQTIIAINLRGTTAAPDSWIENFYAAMIPAKGSLKLSNAYTFNYKFVQDPKAMVHVGWTIGVGSLAPDIVDKIQRYYKEYNF